MRTAFDEWLVEFVDENISGQGFAKQLEPAGLFIDEVPSLLVIDKKEEKFREVVLANAAYVPRDVGIEGIERGLDSYIGQ